MSAPLPHRTATVKEVAALYGVTERAITKRLERGTLSGTKFSSGWLVNLPEPDPVQAVRSAEKYGTALVPEPVPALYIALVALQERNAAKDSTITAQTETITVLKRDAERERNRAEQAEERIAVLIAELAELRRPWWRFWR